MFRDLLWGFAAIFVICAVVSMLQSPRNFPTLKNVSYSTFPVSLVLGRDGER